MSTPNEEAPLGPVGKWLSDPEHWCKERTETWESGHCRTCLIGAVYKEIQSVEEQLAAFDKLRNEVQSRCGLRFISFFNDLSSTTHADIMSVCRATGV